MTDDLISTVRARLDGMTWRQVLIVRDALDDLLDCEINRRQADDRDGVM